MFTKAVLSEIVTCLVCIDHLFAEVFTSDAISPHNLCLRLKNPGKEEWLGKKIYVLVINVWHEKFQTVHLSMRML